MKGEKGSTNLIILCTSILVIILSAVIADLGYGEIEYYKLKKETEKVTAAGARELLKGGSEAAGFTKAYALQRVNDLNELEVKVSDSGREITVFMGRPFNYKMISIVGIRKRQLEWNVTAKVSNICSYKGVRPIAIEERQLKYGRKYTLSDEDRGEKDVIPFTVLKLGKGEYAEKIISGYQKGLNLGEKVFSTDSENRKEIKSCVLQLISSYSQNNSQSKVIIVIPVVSRIDYTGTVPMTVEGFSAFCIESCEEAGSGVKLTGRFVKMVSKGNTSDGVSDFGVYGIETTEGV